MKAVVIDYNGTLSDVEISRKEIAHEFSMYIRDLRPVFSTKQLSTISPRGAGIVLNFWNIKLVTGKNKVFLFHTEPKNIQEGFLPDLALKIQQKENKSPFELLIIEATLSYAFTELNAEFEKNETGVHKILYKLKKDVTDQQFELLLNYKKHINKLQIAIKELEEALEETIKDDEDIIDLCLSKEKEESEEVESILEHSWEQFEDLSHRIHELSENIDDTQEVITLKMANRRNAIIKFDLYTTIVTAIFSAIAIVVGIFGMNLKSSLENNPFAFLSVLAGIFIFMIVSIIFASLYLRKKKLW